MISQLLRGEAVLFDLDGTLIDSLTGLAESANEVLRAAGLPTHPAPSYRLRVGRGMRALVESALPEDKRGPEVVDAIVAHLRTVYAQRWRSSSRPYPGIPMLLDELIELRIPLGVLSNKPHEFTVEMVHALLPSWRFDVVMGAQDGVPLKPDPSAALMAVEMLGVAPARCILLGDSEIDLETARRAGMNAVAATWGFRSREELLSAGAHHLIDTPLALVDLCATHGDPP